MDNPCMPRILGWKATKNPTFLQLRNLIFAKSNYVVHWTLTPTKDELKKEYMLPWINVYRKRRCKAPSIVEPVVEPVVEPSAAKAAAANPGSSSYELNDTSLDMILGRLDRIEQRLDMLQTDIKGIRALCVAILEKVGCQAPLLRDPSPPHDPSPLRDPSPPHDLPPVGDPPPTCDLSLADNPSLLSLVDGDVVGLGSRHGTPLTGSQREAMVDGNLICIPDSEPLNPEVRMDIDNDEPEFVGSRSNKSGKSHKVKPEFVEMMSSDNMPCILGKSPLCDGKNLGHS